MAEIHLVNSNGIIVQIFGGFPFSIDVGNKRFSVKLNEADKWLNYNFTEIRFINDYNGKRYELILAENSEEAEEEKSE